MEYNSTVRNAVEPIDCLAPQIETPSRAGAPFGEFRFVVTFM